MPPVKTIASRPPSAAADAATARRDPVDVDGERERARPDRARARRPRCPTARPARTRARARGRARRPTARARAGDRAARRGRPSPSGSSSARPRAARSPSSSRPSGRRARAVTDEPPPRWHTTSRGTRTCDAAHSTDSPWKPYRRTPHSCHRSRHGVARCLLGHRRVERRVEDGDVGDVRQRALCLVDRARAPARCAAARAASARGSPPSPRRRSRPARGTATRRARRDARPPRTRTNSVDRVATRRPRRGAASGSSSPR